MEITNCDIQLRKNLIILQLKTKSVGYLLDYEETILIVMRNLLPYNYIV